MWKAEWTPWWYDDTIFARNHLLDDQDELLSHWKISTLEMLRNNTALPPNQMDLWIIHSELARCEEKGIS